MSYQMISESESWFHGLTANQRRFICEWYDEARNRDLDLSYAAMIIDAYRIRDNWRTVQGWPETTTSDLRSI